MEPRIYFAAAIQAGREDADFYEQLVVELQDHGEVLTEHFAYLDQNGDTEHMSEDEIWEQDLEWLEQADLLVAEVSRPSLGVGYEIAKAEEWGKPILCLYRGSSNWRLSSIIAGSDLVKWAHYETIPEARLEIVSFLELMELRAGAE